MAYVLEIGQFGVVEQPYSYMRRAQATLHRMCWKQVAISESIESLKEFTEKFTHPGLKFRISGVGEHCEMRPEEFEPRFAL